jgi:hypothetical protein
MKLRLALFFFTLAAVEAQEFRVLPSPQKKSFPHGFDIINHEGTVIKSLPEARSATIQAYIDRHGRSLYMSDWSYERYKTNGIEPNWIVSRDDLPAGETLRSRSLVSFPKPKHLIFYNGARLLDAEFRELAQELPPSDERSYAVSGYIDSGALRMFRLASEQDDSSLPDKATWVQFGAYRFVHKDPAPQEPDNSAEAEQDWTAYNEQRLAELPANERQRILSAIDSAQAFVQAMGEVRRGIDTRGVDYVSIDDYNQTGMLVDILMANYPGTHKVYQEGTRSFNPTYGYFQNPFRIEEFAQSFEGSSGTAQGMLAQAAATMAMRDPDELAWFQGALPNLLQDLADIVYRDVRTANAPRSSAAPERVQAELSLLLEFYKEPAVRNESNYGYPLRLGSESGHDCSFYGMRVYKGGKLVRDTRLFSVVDFEMFVELMMRNFTKRSVGVSLARSDDWMKGFFQTIYDDIFKPIEGLALDVETVIWTGVGHVNLIPLDLISGYMGNELSPFREIPLIQYRSPEAAGSAGPPSYFQQDSDTTILFLGQPAYDMAPKFQSESVVSVDREGAYANLSRALTRSSFSFSGLPGTGEETRILERLINGRAKANVLLAENATEHQLLQNWERSNIVHLATHGFFIDPKLPPGLESGQQKLLAHIPDPFARCGLALASANHTLRDWGSGNVHPHANDGILLGAEIKRLDLSGVDLMVLSACSTAEGEPVDGVNVLSLREAFFQAGVRYLVSTLWEIPDAFTVAFMETFYEHLLSGRSVGDSMWLAKKEHFTQLAENGFTDAVLQVAPFVAVGQ